MSITPNSKQSIRMEKQDYSSSVFYFVTICTQNKLCLFGKVIDCGMELNNAGDMILNMYNELPNKFTDIRCHDMIVMPNHIHFIIENVGADQPPNPVDNDNDLGEHLDSPIKAIIQEFKTITTKHYTNGVKKEKWRPFYKRIWQRDYNEHIIRNEESHTNISNNILTNPTNWESDDYYIK